MMRKCMTRLAEDAVALAEDAAAADLAEGAAGSTTLDRTPSVESKVTREISLTLSRKNDTLAIPEHEEQCLEAVSL